MIEARDRLIVALDVPSVEDAEKVVARLGDGVNFYKIGFELSLAGGLPLAAYLARSGKKIFLDLKLHDIGNTVARAAERAADMGAAFLTVHAYPQTMKSAVEGRAGSALNILAVTVLTSWDQDDVNAAGFPMALRDLVFLRAQQAAKIGVDGLVASAAEAADLRRNFPSLKLVTPGIRPAAAGAGDQKRVMTPAAAIAAGSDYLVVGRPVVAAEDPRAAADAIVAEIQSALT